MAVSEVPVTGSIKVRIRPHGVARWLPGIVTLRSYQRGWLSKDLVAGLVLTAVLVPVGMGYAEAAGLPAINGLYATIVPLLIYALFGPSRILVLGPDSSLAGLIAAVVLPIAGGNSSAVIALAGMLALIMGGLAILAGLSKLGFVTDLLSKPIRYGYLNGIALTVLIGQLPKILGFSVDGDNLLQEAGALINGVRNGLTNWTAVAIGVFSLIVILGLKRLAPRIPGVLIAVIASTAAVSLLDLAATAGISVVGALPQGLPSFQIPNVTLGEIGTLFTAAL